MTLARLTLAALILAAIPSSVPLSGPYADDLSKCLVEQTTEEDRAGLVRWMFTAAALHPAVSSVTAVTEAQAEEASVTMAEMLTRLLTDSCRDEAQKALKYEGETTLNTSFRVLGEVAGQELFSSPEVANGLSALEEHLDADKLKAALESED